MNTIFTEEIIKSEKKFNGILVDVYHDEVRLMNGSKADRELVDHPNGVCIIPIDNDNNCYLIRQFRYGAGKELLEIPAGIVDNEESIVECANRELFEETGIKAEKMEYFGKYYVSPGYSTETVSVFLATGLTFLESNPDENELLKVEKISFNSLLSMLENNEIEDAKTEIAILRALCYFHKML